MSSSDDFFNSMAPPGQKAELKSRRSRAAVAPPAPPPRPAAAAGSTTAASSFTFHTGTPSTARSASRAAAAPPLPRRPAQQQKTSTSRSSVAAPSFYGNTTGGFSSSSNTPAASSSSSYCAAPAPAAFQSSTNHASGAAPSMGNEGWYSAPAPAAQSQSTSDWYSAPQQQMQPQPHFQPQEQPTMTPSFTDFNQSSFAAPKSGDLAGAMDGSQFYSSGGANYSTPKLATMQSSSNLGDDDLENEPPLLEELGINLQHIFIKTRAVVLPLARFGHETQSVMHDDTDDLAGPLVFALALGGELLLTGKLQFSYIYGFGLFGCLSMTLVLNLMSPMAVNIWTVASILGYALLPVNVLAVVKIFVVNLGKLEKMGALLAVLTVAWCTVASTRLLEQKCGMRDQRYLVAYPIALLYSAFVMITIF